MLSATTGKIPQIYTSVKEEQKQIQVVFEAFVVQWAQEEGVAHAGWVQRQIVKQLSSNFNELSISNLVEKCF